MERIKEEKEKYDEIIWFYTFIVWLSIIVILVWVIITEYKKITSMIIMVNMIVLLLTMIKLIYHIVYNELVIYKGEINVVDKTFYKLSFISVIIYWILSFEYNVLTGVYDYILLK